MMYLPVFCLLIVSLIITNYAGSDNRLAKINSADELTNLCMKGNHHKNSPSPSPSVLHGHCKDWSKMSCCTKDTSIKIHDSNDNMYNFNMSHCGQLSEECLSFFKRDHCLYECSPNLGPWLVQESRKIRDERFYRAPLCPSECKRWFDACKYDKTCVPNWSNDFTWVKGKGNVCPSWSHCKPFHEIYNNAVDFCETVWDKSWNVGTSDKNCFQLFWKGTSNPNRQVAIDIAKSYFSVGAVNRSSFMKILVSCVLVLIIRLISRHHS